MLCPIHFFFFNDTATTEIYTLSLHDALPIFVMPEQDAVIAITSESPSMQGELDLVWDQDRKSTRLNSSHSSISYAVFCLKKKNQCGGLTRPRRSPPRDPPRACTGTCSNGRCK